MHALIVDDDPDFRLLMSKMAEEVGLEPSLARNGDEAWAVLAEQHVPLLLVDWMMDGGLEGPELIRRVRGREETAYTYIIMITTRSGRADLVHGLDAGADDFVTKPLTLDEFTSRVAVARRTLALQDHVRRLEGLLSICSYCKAIRDEGSWISIERYVESHSEAEFTHGICETCFQTRVAARTRPTEPS